MILTQEQLAVRDAARNFARKHLAPHSAEWERTSTFPRAARREMGKLGFLGMTVPPEWDGAGMDYVAYALALEEIAAGDGATATVMSGHNSVGCMPLVERIFRGVRVTKIYEGTNDIQRLVISRARASEDVAAAHPAAAE